MVKENKSKNKNNNSYNSLVFGRWPQTKILASKNNFWIQKIDLRPTFSYSFKHYRHLLFSHYLPSKCFVL